MILVNLYEGGEKTLAFSAEHFGVDYKQNIVELIHNGAKVTRRFKKFNHNHITGSDYHILDIEVDNEKE